MLYSFVKDTPAFSDKVYDIEKKAMMTKIATMKNLPVPNEHVMKLMLMLRDEDCPMSPIVDAIERDQSLVAQVLKLVNSGFYGLRKTIDSVERAATLLGILNIKNIVYSASVMTIFSEDEKAEWEHSFAASTLISEIVKEKNIDVVSNLSLVMLLHDIGKVALRRFSPKKYKMAVFHSKKDKIPMSRTEKSMLKFNHAEISEFLLEKWQMTDDIIYMITNHHTEEIPKEYTREIALIQFVDWIDSTVRGGIVFPPTFELMQNAGIEFLNDEIANWKDFQLEFIKDNETPDNIKENKNFAVLDEGKNDTGTKVMKRFEGFSKQEEIKKVEQKPKTPISVAELDNSYASKLKVATNVAANALNIDAETGEKL